LEKKFPKKFLRKIFRKKNIRKQFSEKNSRTKISGKKICEKNFQKIIYTCPKKNSANKLSKTKIFDKRGWSGFYFDKRYWSWLKLVEVSWSGLKGGESGKSPFTTERNRARLRRDSLSTFLKEIAHILYVNIFKDVSSWATI